MKRTEWIKKADDYRNKIEQIDDEELKTYYETKARACENNSDYGTIGDDGN